MKNKLIKLLGGYTSKEYYRVERKYQALLDSKSDVSNTYIINEYIWRIFRDLDNYMKSIYKDSKWGEKVYNVIHNNMLRVLIRYVNCKASAVYKFDTTLDGENQFMNILKDGNEEDAIEYVLNHLVEND